MRTDQQPIRISLIAPNGRMGKAIAAAVAEDPGFAIDQDHADVLIDFSAPAALQSSLDRAVSAGVPILIGTTGLDDLADKRIADAASRIPVLQTGNTSLGITLLAHLVREAATKLGAEWDIEIVEMHHRMKVDAPSGTAVLLGQAAAEGRGVELAASSERGRDGITGPRKAGAIGFASLRGGTVAGDHEVIFAGPQERITLAHSAENRAIFAHGALTAAKWLIDCGPGLYSMREVLGL